MFDKIMELHYRCSENTYRKHRMRRGVRSLEFAVDERRSIVDFYDLEKQIKRYYYDIKSAQQKYLIIDFSHAFSFESLNASEDSEDYGYGYRYIAEYVCDLIPGIVDARQLKNGLIERRQPYRRVFGSDSFDVCRFDDNGKYDK